jgi:hypothetical protein
MKTVLVTIATVPQLFPSGTTIGNFRYSLSNGATQDSASLSVTFADVAPGTYTVSAQRMDASNSLLGSPIISDAFTITDDVSIDVPSTVSITLS